MTGLKSMGMAIGFQWAMGGEGPGGRNPDQRYRLCF